MDDDPLGTEQDYLQNGIAAQIRQMIGPQAEAGEGRLIHVIVNPASGQGQPVLKMMNAAAHAAKVEWDVFVTKAAGDARRLAQESVEAGADRLVVYGGDGTVMEAASGLIGSDTPLAFLPGGTGNVMASELKIPFDLMAACALAVDPFAKAHPVDVGFINEEHYFLLRASSGLEALMVEGADPQMKERLGSFAYALAGMQALADPPVANYRLQLDGQEIEMEGLTCVLANSGNVGRMGMSLLPNISISDGLLDVLVLRKADLPSVANILANMLRGQEESLENLARWQAQSVRVESEPVQKVQVDGEILTKTPIEARILKHAVRIIAPEKEEQQI